MALQTSKRVSRQRVSQRFVQSERQVAFVARFGVQSEQLSRSDGDRQADCWGELGRSQPRMAEHVRDGQTFRRLLPQQGTYQGASRSGHERRNGEVRALDASEQGGQVPFVERVLAGQHGEQSHSEEPAVACASRIRSACLRCHQHLGTDVSRTSLLRVAHAVVGRLAQTHTVR